MAHASGRCFRLAVALVLIAGPAAAQDDPRLALLVSFPSPTVSLQWELSEKFALRIEGSYNYFHESTKSSDSASGGASEHVYLDGTSSRVIWSDSGVQSTLESTAHSGSIGLAGIFTMYRTNQLRLYVMPRIAVALSRQRITAETTLSFLPVGTPPVIFGPRIPRTQTVDLSSTSPSVGAAFGAATNVHRHLALFGEAGFSYLRSDVPAPGTIGTLSSISTLERQWTTVGTRAVGGLMILF